MDRKYCILIVAASSLLVGSVVAQFDSVTSGDYIFSVSHNQLPWAQAVTACEEIGQRLASVEDPVKDDLLVQLFVEQRDNNVTLRGNSWIAATEVREGVWHWETLQKPLYHTRWFVSQPDDTENLNCVYLASQYLLYWRDANCSASMYFICESRQDSINNVMARLY